MENFRRKAVAVMFNIKNTREINHFTGIRRGFLGIIVATFIFNMFFAGFLNITSQIKEFRNKNFIMAELQSRLSQAKKEELEEKFLNLKEVQKVTYVDSYTAFQDLQKNLGIVIPRGENPLPDTFRIYFKNAKDVETLQAVLEDTQEIKEFFIDGIYISEIDNRIRILNLFGIIFAVGIVCSLFMINSMFRFQLENDYLVNVIGDSTNARNRLKAKNVNLLPFTVAVLVSLFLFFNFYVSVRRILVQGVIFTDVLSLMQIFYIQTGAIILIILFAWFMPVNKRMGERK